jgi:hypothetical protein
MALLLYCDIAREGMIATPADKVDGVPMPPRHYRYDGHFVVLDGNLPHVLEHDAREICKIAGHRLARPQECNAYYGHYASSRPGVLTESTTMPGIPEDNPAPENDSAPTSQVLTTDTAPMERTTRAGRRKG